MKLINPLATCTCGTMRKPLCEKAIFRYGLWIEIRVTCKACEVFIMFRTKKCILYDEFKDDKAVYKYLKKQLKAKSVNPGIRVAEREVNNE